MVYGAAMGIFPGGLVINTLLKIVFFVSSTVCTEYSCLIADYFLCYIMSLIERIVMDTKQKQRNPVDVCVTSGAGFLWTGDEYVEGLCLRLEVSICISRRWLWQQGRSYWMAFQWEERNIAFILHHYSFT